MKYQLEDLKVYVATHKKVDTCLPEYCKKIEVNSNKQKELWEGYFYDNQGIEMADKNFCYSELTAVYWIWKNTDSKIKGLCHYRRFFSQDDLDTLIPVVKCKDREIKSTCASDKYIVDKFNQGYECIAIKPYQPCPENIDSELNKYVYRKDIDTLKAVVLEKAPDYYDELLKTFESKHTSYYNMMIATDKVFDNYCEWLFDLMAEVEERCDISEYDTQHKRLYGYLSEVLLGVYLRKKKIKTHYVKAIYLLEDNQESDLKMFLYKCRRNLHNILYRYKMYGIVKFVYKHLHKNIYDRLKSYEDWLDNK